MIAKLIFLEKGDLLNKNNDVNNKNTLVKNNCVSLDKKAPELNNIINTTMLNSINCSFENCFILH